MKKAIKDWLWTFLAGFLATVLGIVLTFGIQNRLNERRKTETARLLARQIVDKMAFTHDELYDFQEAFNRIDSTSMILHLAIQADTLDRVDDDCLQLFLNMSLGEYVRIDVDNGMDAYKVEILNTIGDVELIGHIDQFYSYAREYSGVAGQVVDQKRIVADLVYANFYGKWDATIDDYVRYLHELPEFNVYYSRMQNIRPLLKVLHSMMNEQLDACRQRLGMQH